jgi:hypothetical protein
MKADEAAEMMDQDKTHDRFKQRAAVTIAILAMILAITGLGGSNAGKEAVNNNVLASNYWNFFQAKNMRQTAFALAAVSSNCASPRTIRHCLRRRRRN